MSYRELIESNVETLVGLAQRISKHDFHAVELLGRTIAKTLKGGGTVFWSGNGGSAADAQHLSAELIGRLVSNRAPLSSVALNSDVAAITCIANDFGYENIFSRQLDGLASSRDLLIVLSTSGESANVLEALHAAKRLKLSSAALLGKGGGSAKSIAEIEIVVDSMETARIQEIHKLIGHTACQIAERELGFSN